MEQKLRQFSRIRFSRRILQFTRRIKSDSGLGSIGNDETHLRIFGQFQKLIILRIRIQSPAHHIDQLDAVHFFTVL